MKVIIVNASGINDRDANARIKSVDESLKSHKNAPNRQCSRDC